MRRGRIFFYLAFILILGLAAVFLVYQRFMKPTDPAAAQPQPTQAVEMVNVVVVTQRVPRGNVLDEAVLGVVPTQKDLFIQGMFSNINEVVGRQVKFDLDAGIPLTSNMLINADEQLSSTGSTAALSIPRGMVAVSVPINRLSSVSYAPRPGDHVNVIVSMLFVDMDTDFQTILPNNTGTVIAPGPTGGEGGGGESVTGSIKLDGGVQGRAEIDPVLGQTIYVIPSESQRPRMASQTLLQDAVILQMGNFTLPGELTPEQQQAAAQEQVVEGQEAPPPPPAPDVATLIVSPQDAVTLNYLLYTGAQLTLALRAAGDDSRFQTEAVTLQFLLDQYRIPVPVKLPFASEPKIPNLVPPTLKNDAVPVAAPAQ